MNYEQNIFIMLILKKYFAENFGSHYPSELVQMIMECYHRDMWIETGFNVAPKFNKRLSVVIPKYGLGLDQVIFKFVLPELPNNLRKSLKYKQFCVYDLIRNISIRIGGYDILSVDSKDLEMFDRAEQNFEIIKDRSKLVGNKFVYLFDLGYFFKESMSDVDQILPLDFKGIRLINLEDNHLKFHIQLHSICNIIDRISVKKKGILGNLKLDVMAYCHYVGMYHKNYENVNKNSITQQIHTWCAGEYINYTYRSYHKFQMCGGTHVSKIIFYSKMLDQIKYIRIQLDGFDYMEKINFKELHDNMIVIDVDKISSDVESVTCSIWLYTKLYEFEMTYMYDVHTYGRYDINNLGKREVKSFFLDEPEW